MTIDQLIGFCQANADSERRLAARVSGAVEGAEIYDDIVRALRRLKKAHEMVGQQAEDAALWLINPTIAEAYLQAELRKLHEAIENE